MTKKREMSRQGLNVSPNELRNLANKLEMELTDSINNLGVKSDKNEINNTKFQVAIINKEPDCSDTWEIENSD